MKRSARVLTTGSFILATTAIVLTLMYSGCGALAGGGGSADLLESIRGAWSSGIKTGVTIEGQAGVRDTAFIAVLRGSSFAHFLVRDNAGTLVITDGNRGTVATIDEEFITLSIQEEFDFGLGQWVPASQLIVERYLLEGDTLFVVPDINNDLDFDGTTQVLRDNETINMNYDFRINFTKEPEGLTVTGTVTFEGVDDYTGPNDTLGVAMDKTNLASPEHLTTMPVSDGSLSESYSLNNVRPGLYYLGGAVDLGTQGDFNDEEDWLGTFGGIDQSADPPNAVLFSDNTVFDFMLNTPSGPVDVE